MRVKTQMRALAVAGVASLAVAGAMIGASATAAAATGAERRCAVDLPTQKIACAAGDVQAAQLAGVDIQSVKAMTLYDGVNYTGEQYTFYVTAPCTSTYEGEYGIPNLGSFSNRASSVHTYNQCDVHLHDPINYGSPYSTWIDQSANLATIGTGWSNRASSVGIS
jgi:hypothetical protein